MNDDEIKKVMQAMGKRGGETTKARYGADYYKKRAEHMNKVRAAKKAAKLAEVKKGGKTQGVKSIDAKKKSILFDY